MHDSGDVFTRNCKFGTGIPRLKASFMIHPGEVPSKISQKNEITRPYTEAFFLNHSLPFRLLVLI